MRNLAAQAEAIWPQEEPIFARNPPATGSRVLDVGCGTGEILFRLARRFPAASFVGIDLEESHLVRAREKCAPFGSRVLFERGDALELSFPSAGFDQVICRHVLQALPDARRALLEMVRVVKPGGRLHLIAEDYGMLWCHPTELDSDGFWQRMPGLYGKAIGCDLHVGRKTFTHLTDLGLADIAADYLVLDTLRVPRDTFARIWEDHPGSARGDRRALPADDRLRARPARVRSLVRAGVDRPQALKRLTWWREPCAAPGG
ncbi:MAG: class I SAM-dependent methyltransferase [Deltaproteobacteria bacterium]|nr:MAG: class I SAM-dependent methyltransferase [Deltaproteobacteria bacterium]